MTQDYVHYRTFELVVKKHSGSLIDSTRLR